MSMKVGANTQDQKHIAHYFVEGYSSKEISNMLHIKEEVIKNFDPKKQEAAKKKIKAKNKKAGEDHKKIMAAKTTPAILPGSPEPKGD